MLLASGRRTLFGLWQLYLVAKVLWLFSGTVPTDAILPRVRVANGIVALLHVRKACGTTKVC